MCLQIYYLSPGTGGGNFGLTRLKEEKMSNLMIDNNHLLGHYITIHDISKPNPSASLTSRKSSFAMALNLRKATLADVADLVDIYLSAFTKDAVSLLCFPRGNPDVYNWWYDMIVAELTDPDWHSLVITTPAPTSSSSAEDANADASPGAEQVIAWCKWNAPSSKPIGTALPRWPDGADVDVANYFFSNLFTRRKRIMGERRHWYLELIATRPEWQGRGAAGKLIRWGLERADAAALETYIEASPDGRPIYEHLGFREVEQLVVDLDGKETETGEKEFVEVLMLRPAKNS